MVSLPKPMGDISVSDVSSNKLLMVIIAILLPPLAVFLQKGAGTDLVINIVLCIVFWVPGIIHALWVTLR
jgi:uncharacterized membrane protein YqaE (UPF0057 family)